MVSVPPDGGSRLIVSGGDGHAEARGPRNILSIIASMYYYYVPR